MLEKDDFVMIVLVGVAAIVSLVATVIGLYIGWQSPGDYTSRYVFVGVLCLLHALWLALALLAYRRSEEKGMRWFIVVLYLIAVLPLSLSELLTVKFDPVRWKRESSDGGVMLRGPNKLVPNRGNGRMVRDVVESNILVGLTFDQVRDLLGDDYYIEDRQHDDRVWVLYPYTDSYITDPCDRLAVVFEGGGCLSAHHYDCD